MTLREEQMDGLYDDLVKAHPHPFDWVTVLKRPPLRFRREMAGWKKNRAIFASHGFLLTERVADRYRLSDSQTPYEDYGGSVIRRLVYALDKQLLPDIASLTAADDGRFCKSEGV